MIVSYKYRFVLIDIPKTSTTSINYSLLSILDSQDRYIYNTGEQQGFKNTKAKYIHGLHRHSTSKDINDKIKIPQDFKYICFVRNPFDLLVSYYSFLRQRSIFHTIDNLSFKDWVIQSNDSLPRKQIDYINIEQLDQYYIGRFENLSIDFNKVCKLLSIKDITLKTKNKTNHKHYTEYYDDETREIVAEKYARDIERFGYEFGD